MSDRVSRRAVLKGLGVTLALPWLESFSHAAESLPSIAASVEEAAPPAVRLGFVFMPNGVNYEAWAPIAGPSEMEFVLSPTLEALEPVRQHVNIFTGLALQRARANGDGPGDHARSAASFLTGSQARKTSGNDIRLGVSIDQVAAGSLGARTRLPSLELGCEHGPSAGGCDSGYSCAYSNNISWRDESTPMAKLIDPAAAFERLFGDASQAAAAQERLSRRQSVLDFVLRDTQALASRLGSGDKRKLDQFQTAVREVERRIERARTEEQPPALPNMKAPEGIPEKLSEHIDLMYDMMLMAFQTDTTRVATLMMAGDGSNRAFPEIGVKDGHHHLSHHQNNQEMIEKIRRIDRFYVERFGRFVQRLAATTEGDGSLLDNTLILFGGGISDGNRHNHEDLPVVMAGSGGGVRTGRLIQSPRETPLCNLYLSMLERSGCPQAAFADSNGVVAL